MIKTTRSLTTILVCFAAVAACSKDPQGPGTDDGSTGSGTGVGTGLTAEPQVTDPMTGSGTDAPGTETAPTTGDPATTTEMTTLSTGTTLEPMTTTEPDPSSSSGDTGLGVPMPVECGGATYECGDAIDNDGDGSIDGGDPECTSPCDDSESSFQTDLPGQNKDCNADCYWDGDSGQGNDQCVWNLKCDAQNPGADVNCAYDPDLKGCDVVQAAQCLEVCADLTPNGCDCFGCCNVDTPNGTVQIYLGADPLCSLQNLEACGTCTFQEGCNNDCDPDGCELCFGQTELPPGCEEAGCDGKDPCMVDKFGNSNCADGFFCSTGCCQPIEPG